MAHSHVKLVISENSTHLNPPYHMSCLESHPRLYQLSNGRFQIMEEGDLAPMMVGYEYVLVERGRSELHIHNRARVLLSSP
jgi:hypothetical protein